MIAADSVAIEVLIPPGVPLDIAHVSYSQSGGELTVNSYDIVNNGRSGEVTLMTNWTFNDNDSRSPQVSRMSSHVADSWEMADPFLLAGSTQTITGGFKVAGPPVRKITVEIAYVEFDTGDLAGIGTACVLGKLTEERSVKLAAYKDVLRVYEAGVSNEGLDEFMARQPGLEWLKLIRAAKGPAYMVDQIYQVVQLRTAASRLKPPRP